MITQKNSRKEEINQSSAVYQTLPSDAVLPGGPEGDLLEGVTTLDCLVDLDLKDNDLTGERVRVCCMVYECSRAFALTLVSTMKSIFRLYPYTYHTPR